MSKEIIKCENRVTDRRIDFHAKEKEVDVILNILGIFEDFLRNFNTLTMGNHQQVKTSLANHNGINYENNIKFQNEKFASSEDVTVTVPLQTITLERKSNIRRSLGFIFLFLALETSKQICNFALARSNNDKYPVPSSLLVVLAENVKLFLVFFWAKIIGLPVESWIPSTRFSLPAICYCLTNLMYLSSLTIVSPPIWMVLIQTRTLYTAIAYKVVFSREVTVVQAVGCILVVFSISVARLSSLENGQSSISFYILAISQLCAILSTAASIAVELLLKNDGRSFCEQQFWLYVWGSFLGAAGMLTQEKVQDLMVAVQNVVQNGMQFFQLVLAVVTTSMAGLCVPVIVKNLDTIVKDYLSAANNLVLSFVTAFLFPQEFSLSWLYLLSLAILMAGIWLYEKKTLCKTVN